MIDGSLRRRLEKALWGRREAELPRWRARGLRLARTVAVLVRDNTRGELTLRAMGLVYTSLLSLVPLLALSFSVLKAFGVHNQIRPFLQGMLLPLGESRVEISERIVTFINNMNVGVLGSMGLALLLYTAVSLVQKVEEAFNFIWHIARPRGFGERFSRYLTLLLVGPILVFSALGITATVMNAGIVRAILAIEPFGRIFIGISRLAPYLLVIAAFTFAYYFIPNTRVRLASALIGGLVAGVAWQTAGWAFAEFAASSRQYRAVYSGFAILILFMIWLYLNWRILLLGASVAFYHQRPEYLVARGREPRLSNRMRERLALAVMSLICGDFLAGRPPLSLDGLARRLGMPEQVLRIVLDTMEQNGLLVRVGGSGAYLFPRAPEGVPVERLLDCVRTAGEANYLAPDDLPLPASARELAGRIEHSLAKALAGLSLADIAQREPGTRPAGCGLPENGERS